MKCPEPPDPKRMSEAASRPPRPTPLILALASLALLAAGCGSSSPPSPTQSPKSITTAAFDYSSCMRTHGVTNFPDPRVSSGGNGDVSVIVALPRSAVGSPQFRTAQNACRGIMPGPRNVSPAAEHARAQNLLAFARCLRGHGVPDFPDPTSQGQLTIEMIKAAGVDLHALAVLPAAKACIVVSHGAVTGADVARAVNGTH